MFWEIPDLGKMCAWAEQQISTPKDVAAELAPSSIWDGFGVACGGVMGGRAVPKGWCSTPGLCSVALRVP